jgi:hypothetical protein
MTRITGPEAERPDRSADSLSISRLRTYYLGQPGKFFG